MRHLQVKYGKYLNEIDNEIPPEHLLLEQSGEMSRRMEPGEPNLPTGESYSLSIRNIDHSGQFLYPFSFWQAASRSEAEGATQELQLYFQVFVNEESQFLGMLKRVRYNTFESVCILDIGDLTELIRTEERKMLKGYEFEIPRPLNPAADTSPGILIDDPGVDYNDLPTLLDLEGNTLPHESITFQLFVSSWSGANGVGDFDTPLRDGSNRYPFAWHLGWQKLDYVYPVADNDGLILAEQDSPRYVQIGDITIWTRVKLWVQQVRNAANSRSRQELWCTIWHSAVDVSGGVIPRGKFIWDGEIITSETEEMSVIFHEPNYGFDDDIAIYAGTLPLDEKFIMGLPYAESGSNIVITSAEYAFFDVVEKTVEIINTDVSARHTSDGLSGWVEVTSPAAGGDTPQNATGWIQVTQAPFNDEQVRVSISKSGGQWSTSAFFDVTAGQSLETIMTNMAAAINAGSAGTYWTANVVSIGGGEFQVDVVANESGTQWDGYGFGFLARDDNLDTYDPPFTTFDTQDTTSAVSGGFVAAGIDIYIGEQLFATTADLVQEESAADIAQKIFDAVDAVSTDDYTFFLFDTRVNVTSLKNQIEAIRLDVKTTGVDWDSKNIDGVFDIFDLTKLLDDYRLSFFSDIIMFGWIDSTVMQALVSVSWQVGAQLFTTGAGQIAMHSRDWFEFFPDDITDPEFDATLIANSEWEPTAGDTYEEGYKSYETTHPVDVVEINNVISKNKRTIYSDKNGARNSSTLKNKPIRTGNFRTHDLGVESLGFVMRYSPDDVRAPYTFGLERFLPTPRIQLNRIAATYFFPTKTTQLRIYHPTYPVDVGDYMYGEDLDLWLIRNIRILPRQLVAELEVQFRKSLGENLQTFQESTTVKEIFSHTVTPPET